MQLAAGFARHFSHPQQQPRGFLDALIHFHEERHSFAAIEVTASVS
jgi:hypothetical protein